MFTDTVKHCVRFFEYNKTPQKTVEFIFVVIGYLGIVGGTC